MGFYQLGILLALGQKPCSVLSREGAKQGVSSSLSPLVRLNSSLVWALNWGNQERRPSKVAAFYTSSAGVDQSGRSCAAPPIPRWVNWKERGNGILSKLGVANALVMSQWSSHQQGRVFRPSLDLCHLLILWAKQPVLTENNLGETVTGSCN